MLVMQGVQSCTCIFGAIKHVSCLVFWSLVSLVLLNPIWWPYKCGLFILLFGFKMGVMCPKACYRSNSPYFFLISSCFFCLSSRLWKEEKVVNKYSTSEFADNVSMSNFLRAHNLWSQGCSSNAQQLTCNAVPGNFHTSHTEDQRKFQGGVGWQKKRYGVKMEVWGGEGANKKAPCRGGGKVVINISWNHRWVYNLQSYHICTPWVWIYDFSLCITKILFTTWISFHHLSLCLISISSRWRRHLASSLLGLMNSNEKVILNQFILLQSLWKTQSF